MGILALSLTVLTLAGALSGTPAVDRGLPSANLNNAAGANRSNVAWSNGNDFISGDDFTVGATGQTWVVTGIRTWSVAGHTDNASFQLGDLFDSVSLYGGPANPGGVSLITSGTLAADSNVDSNPNITHTQVQYAGGADYQGSSGAFLRIWQNDFANLSWTVQGGVKYNFAVDGTLRVPDSYFWFNHASNAGLSGSPQQGADGKWKAWAKSALGVVNTCDSGAPSAGVCDGGWDKSSDINVQVFASQVATNKDQCKGDGWKTLSRANGTGFKNQGDCIQYINTGK